MTTASVRVVGDDGNIWWLNKDNCFHRTDGPALEYRTGKYSWYLNSELFVTNKEFQAAANLSDEDMIIMILKYGNVRW